LPDIQSKLRNIYFVSSDKQLSLETISADLGVLRKLLADGLGSDFIPSYDQRKFGDVCPVYRLRSSELNSLNSGIKRARGAATGTAGRFACQAAICVQAQGWLSSYTIGTQDGGCSTYRTIGYCSR
jgi:hypothetical protein